MKKVSFILMVVCSELLQCRDLGVAMNSDLSMSNRISAIVALFCVTGP